MNNTEKGSMSNDNLALYKAFESLEKGFRIIWDGFWNGSVIEAFPIERLITFDNFPSPSFPKAISAFICSESYFSALLLSSKCSLVVDADWLQRHIIWINIYMDFPGNWCRYIYYNPESSETDYELAYRLNETFVSAVTCLYKVLDKIRFNEIKVKWKNNNEPSPWPVVRLPETLNRKAKVREKKERDKKNEKEIIKDYYDAFSEITEIAQDVTLLFIFAYFNINVRYNGSPMGLSSFTDHFGRFFKYAASIPTFPELSYVDLLIFVGQTIDLCKKKAEVFSLQLDDYISGTEQHNQEPFDDIGDDILHDIIDSELRLISENLKAKIPSIYEKALQASNIPDSIKTRLKIAYLSCMEIYKCVNKLIGLYNSEHGDTPFDPIPITLSR
jgi:hypothetical protein